MRPPDQCDGARACLSDLGVSFIYLYDFGDDWTHEVTVLGPAGPEPGCVDGHGACPPEDVGGVPGYAELLAALADPRHEGLARMQLWTGNRLRPFDRAATDRWIRRVVGEVPQTVRLLLELTAGTGRPAAGEDDLWPLGALHHYLRRVGLLRLRLGVLTPTRVAAGDDLGIVRRLRSGFDPHTFTTVLSDLVVGVLAGHGPLPSDQLPARVLSLLSHSWATSDGRPVTERDVRISIAHQAPILEGLDLIDTSGGTV